MANIFVCTNDYPLFVVDSTTGTVVHTVTLGIKGVECAVSADNRWLAVVDGATFLQFVDLSSYAVGATIVVASGAASCAWSPSDNTKVYVLCVTGGGSTAVYSATPAGTVSATPITIPTGGTGKFIRASPDGHDLYATNGPSSNPCVARIDVATFTLVGNFTGPDHPLNGYGGLAVSPDSHTVYITANTSGSVYRFDTTANNFLASWAAGLTGNESFSLDISPDGSKLYSAAYHGGKLDIVSTASGALTASTTVPGPWRVLALPDASNVWVSDLNAGQITPVSIATGSAGSGTTLTGAAAAYGAATVPGSGGGGPGTVSAAVVIGPLTITAGGTISGSGTGGGATITGTAAITLGPLVLFAYETSATVNLGPLVIVAVSGRVGPGAHPIPGYRGRWRLTLHTRPFAPATLASTLIAELSDARARRLDQAWNTPATLTFTMDGQSQSAGLIQELLHDVVAWRWDDQTGLEQPVFRGPVTQSADTLDEQSHVTTYTCHDYSALLARRLLTSTYTVTGRDQDLVVSDMLALSTSGARSSAGGTFAPASFLPLSLYTAFPGGGLRGLSGQNRDRTYYGSQNVGTAVDDLSKVAGGFDYDVRPSAVDTTDSLRVFYPQQGVTRTDGIALQYGSTVAALTRTVDSSAYANYVRVLGNNSSSSPTPQLFAENWTPSSYSIASIAVGLWMTADDAPDVTVQAALDDRAAGDLVLDAILVPAYTLTLAPDAYTWGNPNMGDTVPLVVNSGRLNVNTTVRVLGISYAIGDDGQEDVTLTVARPTSTVAGLLKTADRAVKALARR